MSVSKRKLSTRQRTIKVVALTAIIAMAGGVAIGLTGGYVGGASTANSANSLTAQSLPALPAGFTAQQVINAGTTEEATTRYDKATKELVNALSVQFGLKFDQVAPAVSYRDKAADGKTKTLAVSITGKSYTASNQTIAISDRVAAVKAINIIVARYGFNQYKSMTVPSAPGSAQTTTINGAAAVLNGTSKTRSGDAFHVDIVSVPTINSSAPPIQSVVVYFTTFPHVSKSEMTKFKAAVKSEYDASKNSK